MSSGGVRSQGKKASPWDSLPLSGLGAANIFARWVDLDSLYKLNLVYFRDMLIYANLPLLYFREKEKGKIINIKLLVKYWHVIL